MHVFEAVADAALDEPDELSSRRSPRRSDVPRRPPAAGAAAPRGSAAAKPHAQGRGSSTVRVDAERLDQLMHFMGELVLHRTQVEALAAGPTCPGLSQAMQNLTRSSHALQSMVMQVRMIPVEAVFLRFPRLVRDLSTKLGKQVDLQLVGKDTELDRTVVDALGDPLVHLVRNSLDHGLEGPEERVAAGKPATGVLEISAAARRRQRRSSRSATTAAASTPGASRAKAAERGLIAPEAVDSIDMPRAVELLFSAGFSTAEVTSDISGRGVGMDAVRAAIRGLGGEVLMTSEHGQGTSAQIRLPLTLAIMAALIVEADGRPFAIPLDRIERTVRVSDQAVRSVAGRRMLVLSDGVLPIVDASERYGGAGDAGRRVRRRRARRRRALRAHRHPARRPARARHPSAAPRGRRRRRAVRRRRALGRADRPDHRLRRGRRRPRLRLSPKGPSVDPVHGSPARRTARAGQHRLRHGQHGAVEHARPQRGHLRPERVRAADGRGRRRDRRPGGRGHRRRPGRRRRHAGLRAAALHAQRRQADVRPARASRRAPRSASRR